MTKQEAIDLINKRNKNRPSNWHYADCKKFGWGLKPKNRRCKNFGVSEGKEYRKWKRTISKSIRHKKLLHIPLSEEETANLWLENY